MIHASGQRRRWRVYRTVAGRSPVEEFTDRLTERERASLIAAMKEVVAEGLVAARHIRGDIYELRAEAPQASFRIFFAVEGRRGQVLLSLEAISKKTQKTPSRSIDRAERRLRDWRSRRRT